MPRPDLCGFDSDDPDERVADLQFRDVYECAVGHGVATTAKLGAEGECHEVSTEWMPCAEVEKVEAASIPGVELSMEALAATPSPGELREKLAGLISSYNDWIADQRAKLDLPRESKGSGSEPLATSHLREPADSGRHPSPRRSDHFRGIPNHEPNNGCGRTPANRSNQEHQPQRCRCPYVATLSACLLADESSRHCRPYFKRTEHRGPALFPHWWRQDGSISSVSRPSHS